MSFDFTDLVGTWRLRRITTISADGTTRAYDEPTITGLLLYSPDHHVWVVVDTPDDGVLWPSAYVGTVSLTPGGVTHHVSFGTPSAIAGADLTRSVELSERNTRLELTARAAEDTRIRLTWHRIR